RLSLKHGRGWRRAGGTEYIGVVMRILLLFGPGRLDRRWLLCGSDCIGLRLGWRRLSQRDEGQNGRTSANCAEHVQDFSRHNAPSSIRLRPSMGNAGVCFAIVADG